MSALTPSQGIRRWPSLTSYFQRGTSPQEVWYAPNLQNQTAFVTNAIVFAVNTLRALPFTVSRTLVIDRLAFEVTTGGGAGSKCRIGIYSTTSPINFYPTSLMVDGGEFDTTGIAVNSATISITLPPGIYCFAWICGTAAPTVRTIQQAGLNHITGSLNTLNSLNARISVAKTYGALPDTFPAGGTIGNGSAALVTAVRASS